MTALLPASIGTATARSKQRRTNKTPGQSEEQIWRRSVDQLGAEPAALGAAGEGRETEPEQPPPEGLAEDMIAGGAGVVGCVGQFDGHGDFLSMPRHGDCEENKVHAYPVRNIKGTKWFATMFLCVA